MQPDGGLVQHVAHALQVRAELRGEPDALRLAARERGRGAIELQIAEADVARETQRARGAPRADRGRCRSSRPCKLQPARRTAANSCHRDGGSAAIERPRKSTWRATGFRRSPRGTRGQVARRRRRAYRSFHPASSPLCSASKSAIVEPGAEAALAPAVPRVEREQARVELGEAVAAGRAGALGGEHGRGASPRAALHARAPRRAEVERARERLAQRRLACFAPTLSAATGSSMLCSTKRISRGHGAVGSSAPSTRSSRKPLLRAPTSRASCRALARDDQRREQRDLPCRGSP